MRIPIFCVKVNLQTQMASVVKAQSLKIKAKLVILMMSALQQMDLPTVNANALGTQIRQSIVICYLVTQNGLMCALTLMTISKLLVRIATQMLDGRNVQNLFYITNGCALNSRQKTMYSCLMLTVLSAWKISSSTCLYLQTYTLTARMQ